MGSSASTLATRRQLQDSKNRPAVARIPDGCSTLRFPSLNEFARIPSETETRNPQAVLRVNRPSGNCRPGRTTDSCCENPHLSIKRPGRPLPGNYAPIGEPAKMLVGQGHFGAYFGRPRPCSRSTQMSVTESCGRAPKCLSPRHHAPPYSRSPGMPLKSSRFNVHSSASLRMAHAAIARSISRPRGWRTER